MGQLRPLPDVTARKMVGEYVLHYMSSVLGFICNDTLLEDEPAIRRLLPDAEMAPLFPGSKDFVIFPDLANSHLLREVVAAIYEDLPMPKPRKCKQKSEKFHASNFDEPISDFMEFHKGVK